MADKLMVPPKDNLVPEDIHYAKQWGKLAREAKIVPLELNEYQAAAIVQTGRELGLQPLQSLRNMSFIKGRICMSVQLQLALAGSKGVTRPHDWLKESPGKCTVTLERGKERVTCEYTLEDARKAGLISTGGNWDKYQKQMLRWRAIGDALRLVAPDLVMGLLSPEEALSIEPVAGFDAESDKKGPQSHDKVAEVPFPEPEAPGKEAVPEAPSDAGGKKEPKPVDAKGNDKHVQEPEQLPLAKEPPRASRFKFLDAMGEMKKAIGDDTYYKILKTFGYQHASEISYDRDEMIIVYTALKHELQSRREMVEALGILEGKTNE